MPRYDNHWLIGQHIRRGAWTSRLKGQMEERETGNCTQMDPHKHTCVLSQGGNTLLWLAVSSSSLFFLFCTLCMHLGRRAAKKKKKTSTCFLNWKLVVKERERENARQRYGRSSKGVNAVMEGIEERTRKIGEEDEIEEKNGEARKVEMNTMIVFAELLLVEGLLGLKDGF